MSYYKYAERDADSQVNWAEVGQQASDMLLEVKRVRDEKKEAYKQASRESINNLMAAPQGQNQDANNFINNYAHNMINQKMIDKDLFEKGQLSERDYTLRMQNQMDGTNRLFDLQKTYQENAAATMAGIQDQTLQAGLTLYNQSSVEGIANFNNSTTTINPNDGTVGIGLMENKVIDGKMVQVMNEYSNASTAVWLGKILQKPLKFKTDTETSAVVDTFGDKKDVLYEAATTFGAGTLTELMGTQFLATNVKDPADRAIVENIRKAMNDKAESFWARNPLNLTSVLTDDIGGKYDDKSFTYNVNEAKADKSKILLTIDPNTKLPTMDKTSPNYEAQKKEANDYIITQMLSKMDDKRVISTTSQIQRQDEPEWKSKKRDEDKVADTATNMIGKLWYGNDNEVGSAVDYFKGLKNDKGEILFTNILRDDTGVNVTLANGSNEHIDFLDKKGKPRTQKDFIASAGPLLAGQIDVSKSLERGAYQKNRKFNLGSKGEGTTITPEAKYQSYLEQKLPLNIDSMPQGQAAREINKLASDFGLVAEPTGNINEVIKISIPGPNGTTLGSQEFKLETGDPAAINKAIIGYMTANGDKEAVKSKLQNYKPVKVNLSGKTPAKKEVKQRISGY